MTRSGVLRLQKRPDAFALQGDLRCSGHGIEWCETKMVRLAARIFDELCMTGPLDASCHVAPDTLYWGPNCIGTSERSEGPGANITQLFQVTLWEQDDNTVLQRCLLPSSTIIKSWMVLPWRGPARLKFEIKYKKSSSLNSASQAIQFLPSWRKLPRFMNQSVKSWFLSCIVHQFLIRQFHPQWTASYQQWGGTAPLWCQQWGAKRLLQTIGA